MAKEKLFHGWNDSMILQLSTVPATKQKADGLTRFRKELIKVGTFIKASTGQVFKVTTDLLDHWVKTFQRYTAAGNKVGIPSAHSKSDDAKSNQGWALELFRDNNVLMGILDLVDEKLALTNDVSIFVPEEFTDGSGNVYQFPITHIALTPNPVIPGLGNFIKLSLSKGESLMLELSKLAALLNVKEDELTEELIIAALDAKRLLAPAAAPAAAPAVTQAVSASQPDPNPLLTKIIGQKRTLELDNLLRAGLLTPTVKDLINERYVENKALALSLTTSKDDGFDLLVQILTENRPVNLDEVSGKQVLELANVRATKTENPIKSDVDKRVKAAKLKN